ncbi:MAG: hypothetical protein GY757_43615 [bacterium]|nr:hypothetical protein [bacterium]
MKEKIEELKQDELVAMLVAITVLVLSLFVGTMNAGAVEKPAAAVAVPTGYEIANFVR